MNPRPWFARILLLSASLTLIHCGGGGGGGAQAPAAPVQDAPTALKATLFQPPASFHLTWTRPSTAFDGYEFEGRVDSGTYAKLHQGLIASSWTEAYYDAGYGAPELATFSFRVRAIRGASASVYSNEASLRSGLHAPSMFSPYPAGGGLSVSWSNNSKVADTLKLERGIQGSGGTSWNAIPSVPFGTSSWIDREAPEGVPCAYRVTYSKGEESVQATSSSATMPMVAPAQLAATPLVEGVKLSWENPSQVATEVAVMRAPGLDAYASYQQVALVPVGTTSYTDSQLATGYYTYRLENRKAGSYSATSASVQVVTLPPQNGASVTPEILSLPQAQAIRRSSTGQWFLSGTYSYNVAVREPSGGAWTDYLPPNAQSWAAPYFLLDSHDRPHLVYTRSVTQGTQEVALMHAWRDATGWQTEEIARKVLYASSAMPSYTFALDAQDRLHLLWLKSGGTGTDLEYAAKAQGGTWTIESPVTTALSALGAYRLIVDPTGQPHILLGGWQDLRHVTRTGGTWVSEAIPANGATVGWYDFMEGFSPGPDGVSVFVFRGHAPYDGKYDLVLLRKAGGSWLPEEVILTTTTWSFKGILAANPAGTRFALYCSTEAGNVLRRWASGTWTSSQVGPATYGTPLLGFDPADKVYLLLPAGWGSSSSTYPYVLYREQP